MNENQIMEAVKRFLGKRLYNYALMIDGPWGCGKTYFIREKLIPALERDYSVTYISLYGVKDAASISDTIYSRILADIAEKKLPKKFVQGASIIVKAAARWGMEKLDFGSEEELDQFIQLLPSINNRVIIFDDLERCNCSINEVLGQINLFVEHSDANVIIVANESEIGKSDDENKELQMLIALNKDMKVDVPKTNIEMLFENAGRSKQSEWTPEYIARRRKVIFQNDTEYQHIKEKIVGQTIRYEPSLKKVFTGILTKASIKDELLKACGKNIDHLVSYAYRDKHQNVRTFQFFLEKCGIIYEIHENVHDDVLLYTFRSCIRYMQGKTMPVWENEFGQQEFNDGLASEDIMQGFRFVDELITRNHTDLDQAKIVIEYYGKKLEEEGRLEGDPYQQINYWYKMEDSQLEDCLEAIKKNIKSGKYSTLIFPRIINFAATFASRDAFANVCKSILKAIKEYVNKADKAAIKPFAPEQFILADDHSSELYRKWLDEVQNLIIQRMEIIEQKEVLLEENDGEWGQKLLDSTNRDTYIHGHSFVYKIEPEKLCEMIKKSDNQQLDYFRTALSNLYGTRNLNEKMVDDFDHLTKLKKLVDDMTFDGAIKEIIINYLRKNLEVYIEKVARLREIQKQ